MEKIIKEINGIEREFDIAEDGITYTPYVGSGDEKDMDFFISWEDMADLFIEERTKARTQTQ